MIIAIQPDNYGPGDASSPIWTKLLQEAGFEVREVNVYRADILDQLKGCQGFMWRHAHLPHMRQVARRLLPVIERELGMVVYPDQQTCWHYDDKIAQAYLLDAVGVPIPKTWVWFDMHHALEWAKNVEYPLVMKLWSGAGSTNVRLVQSFAEAKKWIKRMFYSGTTNLYKPGFSMKQRLLNSTRAFVKGEGLPMWELHKNYVYFQEFLAGNEFDTRITVVGNKAFGYRRFNRENDFRASGSGKIDYVPQNISTDFIKLAFDVSKKLKAQSCAIDGLWRGREPVVGEVSYTYISRMVYECPGHWDIDMKWHEGHMWPEEAQIQDFINLLRVRFE